MSSPKKNSSRDNTSFRRSSLGSFRSESTPEARKRNGQGRNAFNRSDSSIDVRTPVQDRLKKLQNHLKEEQLKKGMRPETRSQARSPTKATSVNQRLQVPKTQSVVPVAVPDQPTPMDLMEMSPPKRQYLKRRSDQNHNDLEVPNNTKKPRIDKSPSPKINRRLIRRSSSRTSLPESPGYENDIEMTDATIQEEISSLRETTAIRADYSLSMAVGADNRLVIKYNDYSVPEPSAVQQRLLSGQIDSQTLHIIVDTNIFIKDLTILPKLMNRKFPDNLGYPILVIPYIVLKELENLAHRNQGKPIEQSAKAANKFINNQFVGKNTQFRGQKVSDHNVKMLEVESGDDHVLNCSLQVKADGKKVILLSNDVNLRNKALFNDVPAFSIDGIQAEDLSINFESL